MRERLSFTKSVESHEPKTLNPYFALKKIILNYQTTFFRPISRAPRGFSLFGTTNEGNPEYLAHPGYQSGIAEGTGSQLVL